MRFIASGLKPGHRTFRFGVIAAFVGALSCDGGGTTDPTKDLTITVELPIAKIEVTDTLKLSALVQDKDKVRFDNIAITWSSSNPAVATTTTDGNVIGLGAGTTTITASGGGRSGSATLTVVDPLVATVALSPAAATLRLTQSLTVAPSLRDKRGRPVSRPPTWSSSRPEVATVSATGVVTAVGTGITEITSTIDGQAASLGLVVTPIPISSIVVTPESVGLLVGESRSLAASPRDSAGGALSGREVTWSTSDRTVAAVSTSGTVSAVAPGKAVISAASEGVVRDVSVSVVPVPVAAVTVTPASATVIVGLTAQFNAAVKDSVGGILSGRPVAWTTSNSSVATVNSAGLVTTVGAGTATISASSGGRTGSATMTSLPIPVSTVTMTPAVSNLYVFETVQLTATLRDSLGQLLSGRVVEYSSSAPAVATVSATGLVRLVGVGSATITARSEGKSTTVTVSGRLRVTSVPIVPGVANMLIGQTLTLTATPTDSTATALTGRGVAWLSSNSSVASVSGTGVLTAVSAGVATITASSEGASNSITVTVVPVPVASVTATPTTKSLFVTQTVQVTATTLDSIGGTLSGRTLTWSSNVPLVATVSATGLVTALSPGTAIITVSAEGKSATSTVTVSLVPVVSVTLNTPRTALLLGEEMNIEGIPRDSIAGALTGRTVTWTSSNPAVANVGATTGFVTTVAVGSATITATCEGKTASVTLTVSPVPVRSVLVVPASPLLLTGSTLTLAATPRDSINRAMLDRTVTWTSENPTIATVSSTGVVTAVTSGIATIRATSEGVVGTAAVSVVNALYPNEPPGLVKISERTFDALLEDGWQTAFHANLSIISDIFGPKSGPGAGKVVYPAGFVGGNEPINDFKLLDVVTPSETLYVSFWIKFSPNFNGHPGSGVNKIFHIFIAGVNRVFLDADGRGTTSSFEPRINLQQINSDGGFRNLTPNLVPTARMNRDQWYRWEFVLVTNTAGNADGSAEWWLDGVKVGQYNNIGYVRADQAHTWRSLNWAPTWGGSGSTVSAEQSMMVDHIYISGR